MAMGKPCVVPDLGPMRDVLEENVTGIMFPHADYGALRIALLRLIKDPALRIRIGARAKQTVFERHTWAENARFVVQLATCETSTSPIARLGQIDFDTH
jgi:glycosyltransferase involved in cell wall biosynthesis